MGTLTNQVPGIRSQLPHGVQDRFLVEAARRRRAESVLSERFIRWGYQEVIPPSLEYYENLAVGASAELRQAMYRFLDREGQTLALRADFTPQMARMAATKLYDRPMPLRCFYLGSVFRHEEPQAGRKREFTQAGIELIGADTPAADAEVVALAIAALEALQIRDFQINLGQMGFFHALTAGLAASQDSLAAIREAIDHKSTARLLDALDCAGVAGSQRQALRRLPDLIGGPEVMAEAEALSIGLANASEATSALQRLGKVYRLLAAYGVAERVILDLGDVRGMDYYTGVAFRGVAPGLGWPILSGGRYDDLIACFGRRLPAVGFGLGIERALLVQARQGASALPVASRLSVAAHVLMRSCEHPSCLALADQLRQLGCRVEVDPFGLDMAGLSEQARQRGIPRTLECRGDRPSVAGGARGDLLWLLAAEGGERVLSLTELLQEAEAWIS